MKELSVEEKASRYDDAIKRIENIKTGKCKTTFMFTEGLFEYIFPELAESEDEKIREDIVTYLAQSACSATLKVNAQKFNKWIAWLEKQCEQKPTDKVEPKFKVGDWVVYGDEDVDLITGLCDKGYEVNGCAYIPFGCEDDMRYWTIQDAKDGDVLVEKKEERPFIFKDLSNFLRPKSPVAYCGIDVGNDFVPSAGSGWWTDKEVCPATKEQHDTLMRAMADAGYTFDFEKKELKKIEQKDAWSEEDENRFRNLTFLVEHSNEGKGTKEGFVKFINRLKSLKERYTWKPSNEQMENLCRAFNGGTYTTSLLMELYQDLKKLKG